MSRSSLVTAVLLLAVTSIPMHASVILSENFDELAAAQGVTTAGVFSTLNGTNVDIVGPGNGFGFLCAGPESGNCLDLAGTGGNSFGQLALTTTLNLAPGTYNLSFDLIGSQRGDTTTTLVTFGSYSQLFTLASGDDTSGVVNVNVAITGGATQAKLTDQASPDADIGAVLDNVQIATVNAAPEPSGLLLLGTGILGMAGIMRRRRAD